MIYIITKIRDCVDCVLLSFEIVESSSFQILCLSVRHVNLGWHSESSSEIVLIACCFPLKSLKVSRAAKSRSAIKDLLSCHTGDAFIQRGRRSTKDVLSCHTEKIVFIACCFLL